MPQLKETTMKLFITSVLLLFSFAQADAAFIRCQYEQNPCDEQGNHYACEYFSWAGGEFCAPTDMSTRSLAQMKSIEKNKCTPANEGYACDFAGRRTCHDGVCI